MFDVYLSMMNEIGNVKIFDVEMISTFFRNWPFRCLQVSWRNYLSYETIPLLLDGETLCQSTPPFLFVVDDEWYYTV